MRDWQRPEEDEKTETTWRKETSDKARKKDLTADDLTKLKEAKPKIASDRDFYVSGDSTDVTKLASATERLESTDEGHSIAEALRDAGTTVRFGRTDSAAIAQYDPKLNEVTISDSQKEASPEVLAAHIAHEGTHVQWLNAGVDHNSIDQEYHAMKTQDAVWKAVKGDQKDDQCDWISEVVAKGEFRAKMVISLLRPYQDLPDY
jgi:outer membrane murein-binding lipoprotein Lpp